MDKKQLTDNFKTILNLEWLGVRIEDIKEERSNFGFTTKTVYYYSVPESSIIELDNQDLNSRIKTSDGLKLLAKETLTDMLIKSCKIAYPNDEEFIEDVKSNVSEYFKFCAKVRRGEVWNKEMGDNRVKELCEDVQQAAQYKEV